MRKMFLGVLTAMLMIAPVMFLTPVGAKGTPNTWTVMAYFDADNNLELAVSSEMEELMSVGSTKNVNIVVLLDTFSGPANLLYVNQGSNTTLAEWGEVNMGDPATLQAFISQAVALYPAENYVLDIWDHGGGIRGVCWDDTSGSDCLTMPELRSAIMGAGVAVDVVMFDACAMAQVEIAHQFLGYADYIVFSQNMVRRCGFPYDTIMARLVAEPTMTDMDFAIVAADEFALYYEVNNLSLLTISVFDMSCVTAVASAVGTFASEMVATMSTTYNTYTACGLRADEIGAAVDLMSFAELVSASMTVSTTVSSAAAAVVGAVDVAIIYERHSNDCHNLYGLGIWFPLSTYSDYWNPELEAMYRSMLFDEAAHWADFLNSYYAMA